MQPRQQQQLPTLIPEATVDFSSPILQKLERKKNPAQVFFKKPTLPLNGAFKV